jgi:DNA-binding response OmpR family regulator
LGAGCDDFIPKPFDVDYLHVTVERWLSAAPA